MIKFFRKVRQKLLSQKKITAYFFYALGEILLVVIGILIAVQVNNWNVNNKVRAEELKLLKEMVNNLDSDIEDCIWNINKNQDLLKSNLAVLRQLEERIPLHDSLRTHYGNISYATTQRKNHSAYEYLKSRGMNLVQNDSLRRNIADVYSLRFRFIERKELEYDSYIQVNLVIPQLIGKIIVDDISKMGYPISLEELYDDEVFKGTLYTNVNAKRFMVARYENLKEAMESLKQQINEELRGR